MCWGCRALQASSDFLTLVSSHHLLRIMHQSHSELVRVRLEILKINRPCLSSQPVYPQWHQCLSLTAPFDPPPLPFPHWSLEPISWAAFSRGSNRVHQPAIPFLSFPSGAPSVWISATALLSGQAWKTEICCAPRHNNLVESLWYIYWHFRSSKSAPSTIIISQVS